MVTFNAALLVIATAFGLACAQGSSSASGSDITDVNVDTVNRTDVPIGTKTYVTGLLRTEDGPNQCGGALITPNHVLTSSRCMLRNIRWASVGTHYWNGTQDGERIKIVAMMSHPNYSLGVRESNDFMVVELEKPSSFTPVALAAADDSDLKAAEWASLLGWAYVPEDRNVRAHELRSAEVRVLKNEECWKFMTIDDTMVCDSGLENEDSCQGDVGAPLVIEDKSGDVFVGVVSWGYSCFSLDVPNVVSRVSSARPWIDSGAKSACFI